MTKKGSMVAVIVLICLLASTITVSADTVNVIKNGSFEGAFVGGVGEGWTAFDNGGAAAYGWDDDAWDKMVYDGAHSQIVQIRSAGVTTEADKDRYAGIYQTVNVVPGQRYMFSFYGTVRSSEGSEQKSGYGYRFQIAFDYSGGTDPWAPLEWEEMDRWPEHDVATPGPFQGYAHGITPTSDKVTVFIRAWKKFPTVGQTGTFNIDAVSLLGPSAGQATTPASDTKGELPDTGAGYLLQMLGAALGIVAVSLTGLRLARRRV